MHKELGGVRWPHTFLTVAWRVPLISVSADIPRILHLKSYFCNKIEGEMIFGIAEVSPRHLMTSDLYLTSEPSTGTSVLRAKNIILKRNLHCNDDWATSLSVPGWGQLFCLEASIHFKICAWRQIIVILKAKDYSFERYINSENRVISLWYSIWRAESRGRKYIQPSYFLKEGTWSLANWLMLSDALNAKNRITER